MCDDKNFIFNFQMKKKKTNKLYDNQKKIIIDFFFK